MKRVDQRNIIDAIMAEAAGSAVAIHIVRPDDMPALVIAAADGDAQALALLGPARDTLLNIRVRSRGNPARCACCPRVLFRCVRFTVVLVMAEVQPTTSLCLAICPTCSDGTDAEIIARVQDALMPIWPEVRAVEDVN